MARRSARGRGRGKGRHARAANPPDILYFATTVEQRETFLGTGWVRLDERAPLNLVADEAAAWRVAHRQSTSPAVLYVDASRARRHGVRFWRRKGSATFQCSGVRTLDVLNLQPHYEPQLSAGGIPVVRDERGVRLALVRVERKRGLTWEIAKGKLEDGETPEQTAVREVREEMGIDGVLEVSEYLGELRYGFVAPGGLPRLKTVFVYLLAPRDAASLAFSPAADEGIREVAWFTPEEAAGAVSHRSLKPFLRRLCQRLTA